MEKPLRILMLEDNGDDAELLEFELQEAGFDYVSRRVINEEDFLGELREFSPDIILSDYDLPTYSGAKALAATRTFCPDIPFILVTGAISEDRAIDTLTSGAKDYVMKTRLHRLAPAIKRALAEAEEHNARRKAEEDLRIAHRELEKQVAERTSELKESRERLSLALASSKMGIFEWDIVQNKRYWDDNVHMILGTSPEHFTGTAADFFNVVHPEDRIIAKDSFKRAIDQDDLYEADLRAVWPDGSIHYIATRGKVYHDHSGIPVRMIGVCWDITERKKAEEALRHSERRERERAMELAALLDAVPMPVFIAHDPGCLQLTGNRAANDFMMHSNSEETSLAVHTAILSGHFNAFKDGRKLDIEELPIQRAARGIKVQDFEYSLVMKEGATRHVLGYSTPLLDAHGSPRGAVQALVDITDHKRIEEKLREANAGTEAILTGIADVFYSLDNNWRFTVVNPAAERELFGRSADELLGKVIWEIFPALVGTKPQQCFFDVVKKNEMGHYEAKSPLNRRWYEVFVSPRQCGLDIYLRNIDKRKQAENALREALLDVENSRSRLEAVFAAQNDIVLIYDTTMDVQKANKAFLNIYGFDPTGLNIRDLIKRVSCRWLSGKPLLLEDQPPTIRALKGESVTGVRFLVKGAGETEIAIEISTGPIKTGNQITGVVTVWHDITEQVKTEAALRASEAKANDLIKYAPTGIFEVDNWGDNFLSVNDAMCRFLGYTRAELFATSPQALLDDNCRTLFTDYVKRRLDKEKIEGPMEWRVRKKNGALVDVLLNVAISSVGGEPGRALVIAHDITWSKQAEAALRESEKMHRTIVETANEGIITVDPESCITYVNNTVAEMLGFAPTELIGKTAIDFLDPDYLSLVLLKREERRLYGIKDSYEAKVIRKDKSSLWVLVNTSPLFDESGKFTGTLGMITDITKRKQSENVINELTQRLNCHVNNSPLAVIEWGADLRLTRWSGEAERIFGWRADEVLGKSMEDFRWIHKENDEHFMAILKNNKQKMIDPQRFSINRNYHKDGSIVYCEWYNSSMLDEKGNLQSILSLVLDVTKRRQAEMALVDQALKLQERTEQLEEINRELENFGYSISHDLRAPLRAIEGYARMILKRQGDKLDKDTLAKFNVIRSSAETMEKIIDTLLKFSHLGRKALNVTEVDMAGLVMSVWQDLQYSNPEREVTLKVSKLSSCRGDKNLLRQVFANLLANAVKFTRYKEKAQIEVTDYMEGNEHVYYVRDNGAGFDMEYHDKLFVMFRRLHRIDEFEGTGIGLATVSRIIRKHGGRVWAEGKVNEGATFFFTLPLSLR